MPPKIKTKEISSEHKTIKEKLSTSIKEVDDLILNKKINEIKNRMIKRMEIVDQYCLHPKKTIEEIKTDWNDVLVYEDGELRPKKNDDEIVASNVELINQFPNALLLDDSIYSESDSAETVQADHAEPDNEVKSIDNIWSFVDQIREETKGQSADDSDDDLDDLTTSSPQPKKNTTTKKTTGDSDDKDICKGCGDTNSMVEDCIGFLICQSCGMINDEYMLDHSPEWRTYNNDDGRGDSVSRCGCPSNYYYPKSSQGTIIAGPAFNNLKRKQKWSSFNYRERSLSIVVDKIKTVCEKNGIQKIVIDGAVDIYNKLSKCKHKSGTNEGKYIIIRGCNRNSIIAACVFFACVIHENPRNLKEIAAMFEIGVKRVTKGCKQLFKLMKNCDDHSFFDQLDTSTPEHYIRRYCPKLRINKTYTELAVTIAKNCCRIKAASDHNPISLAAGSIMLMVDYVGLSLEKRDIAEIFKTSEVTITKIYDKIAPYQDALVDNDATTHLVKIFNLDN